MPRQSRITDTIMLGDGIVIFGVRVVSRDKMEMVNHGMRRKSHPSSDFCDTERLRLAVGHRQLCDNRLYPVEPREEIGLPCLSAKFPIGDALQADLFLTTNGVFDPFVFS